MAVMVLFSLLLYMFEILQTIRKIGEWICRVIYFIFLIVTYFKLRYTLKVLQRGISDIYV